VLQAKSELDRVKAGPTSAEVDQANIAVEQAQAQLDRTQSAYQQMTLVAPFDGVVSAVNVEPGALVAPGVAVVELTDISPLRLTVQVDEIDIGQVHAGVPATVQLDALPGVQLSAKLDDIALVGSNNNGVVSYDAHLTLEDSDPRARVGMTAEASFLVQESDRVLVIPNIYIRLDSKTNQAFVNVLNSENKLHEVEVKLGLRGQDSSEVLSGLSEGDLIGIDLSGDRFALFGS
jgi:HlyD family secretion protein